MMILTHQPRCQQCGGPLSVFDGERFCPDCTTWTAAQRMPAEEQQQNDQQMDSPSEDDQQ